MNTKHTKRTLIKRTALLVLLSSLNPQLSTWAQGTAFTYQGRLQNNGSPANGSYDLTFALFNALSGPSQVGSSLTNTATAVSNGLFTVTMDFGPGVFTGTNYWLDVAVRTNGGGAFTELTPRQPLTPTPYAIYTESVTASGISGTLTNGQLAHSAVTVNPGPGLSGGGRVALGNTIILTNTGVLSVTGNADITASTVGGAVTLGDTASTLVKRDGSGSFSAATITLDGNLNLPATTATAGIIYSGGVTMIHAHGSQNFFAGPAAGNLTMSGINSTANGYHALLFNTSGSDDTAIGTAALLLNTSGSDNTAIGTFALFNNTSGSSNTVSGSEAMFANTTGSYNTANGAYALFSNTNGSYNTANGEGALFSNTGDSLGDGSYNTANGYQALYANTIGTFNTANGSLALYSNTSGYANTASGGYALYNNTNGVNNTASGADALFYNTSGSQNTANGVSALYFNTSGTANTASGGYALYNNTIGYQNTANGFEALFSNTTGTNNTANGVQALAANTTGFLNTANGFQALHSNTTGSYNTANGEEALLNNTSGYENEASGGAALYSNTTGAGNTAVGQQALQDNTTGVNNIALGAFAGASLTIGSNNIDIGSFGNIGEGNTIRIGFQGTQTKTFIAGISGVTISPSGGAVYINANGQLGTVNSSQRFKEAIQDMASQSDILLSLRPVSFHYKPGLDPQRTPQYGLIAEEVEQVAPQLVLRDAKGEVLSVRYEQINAMLLNEFLKEHRTVQAQDTEIQELTKRLEKLEQLINKKNGGAE